MIRKILFLVFAGLLVWVYLHFCGAKSHPPGVLISAEPEQTAVDPGMEPFKKGDFILKPLAKYSIDARVLHTKHYWVGDVASLVPYDVAVGWGPMSDQSLLDQLTISQGNRFFFFEYSKEPPIPKGEIISHASNMHLIPSTFGVRTTIAWLRPGDLVRMQGYLVEATNPNIPGMKPWSSSLSRTDSGNGACELMWVESIEKF